MDNKHFASAVVALAIATGLLSGCATAPATVTAEQSAEAFTRKLAEADTAEKAADKAAAIRLYQALATDNPSKAEPWARIAQIHFDQGNYSLAIQAAEESLKRDPANRQAKSVNAVGGLRLAARSLEELRADSSLTGDASADAQRLVALLRETLGTSALLPAAEGGARKAASPVRRARPAPTSPTARSAAPAKATPGQPTGGDPFGALK